MISIKPDQERVKVLLTETISLLCKNGLSFDSDIRIQGLLGITIDGRDIFIVQLNESLSSDDDRSTDNNRAPVVKNDGSTTDSLARNGVGDRSARCNLSQRESQKLLNFHVRSINATSSLRCGSVTGKSQSPSVSDEGVVSIENIDGLNTSTRESGSISHVNETQSVEVTDNENITDRTALGVKRESHADEDDDIILLDEGENDHDHIDSFAEYGSANRPNFDESGMLPSGSSGYTDHVSKRARPSNDSTYDGYFERGTEALVSIKQEVNSDDLCGNEDVQLQGSCYGGERSYTNYSWGSDVFEYSTPSATTHYSHGTSRVPSTKHAGWRSNDRSRVAAVTRKSKSHEYSSASYIDTGHKMPLNTLGSRQIRVALITHIITPAVFAPNNYAVAFRIIWRGDRLASVWRKIHRYRIRCDELVRSLPSTQFLFSSVTGLISKPQVAGVVPVPQSIRPAISYYWVGTHAAQIADDFAHHVAAELADAEVKLIQSHRAEGGATDAMNVSMPLFTVLKDYNSSFVARMIRSSIADSCCDAQDIEAQDTGVQIAKLIVANSAIVDRLTSCYEAMRAEVPGFYIGLETVGDGV